MAKYLSCQRKFASLQQKYNGTLGETCALVCYRALAVGRGSTAPVKNAKLPEVVKTEPWDGKDGEVRTPKTLVQEVRAYSHRAKVEKIKRFNEDVAVK